jgi:predicted DNA binding CopG/RHH family protein
MFEVGEWNLLTNRTSLAQSFHARMMAWQLISDVEKVLYVQKISLEWKVNERVIKVRLV